LRLTHSAIGGGFLGLDAAGGKTIEQVGYRRRAAASNEHK
jgi:hypothetical protein